jgi:ketosteroid isomerase-like protein
MIVLTCLAISAPALADPAAEVRCREIGFSQSAERRDMDAFRSYLDADARFISARVLRGKDEIADAWQVFFEEDGPEITWRPQFVEVLDDGKLALSRGPYRVVAKDEDGNLQERWGTFNSTWRLHDDGVWRVVFDAGGPAATEPDEATKSLLDEPVTCP